MDISLYKRFFLHALRNKKPKMLKKKVENFISHQSNKNLLPYLANVELHFILFSNFLKKK